jgi:polyisoprenoid-binding protein YceI
MQHLTPRPSFPWLVLVCLVALASCTVVPPSPPSPPVHPLASLIKAQAQFYRIDPAASTLHILVYRGGPMARLGHNHVVSSHNLQGRVWRGVVLENSGFDITVPVNDLVVDDNAARATEGEDFALNVSEDAKHGTKANMLRDTLLDGARYPEIRIMSVRVQGDANAPQVIATLRIRDQTRQVTVPVTLQTAGAGLRVTGSFQIRQTDFGITPLSIALGALQVVDAVTIKFVLVAVPD